MLNINKSSYRIKTARCNTRTFIHMRIIFIFLIVFIKHVIITYLARTRRLYRQTRVRIAKSSYRSPLTRRNAVGKPG